MGAWLDEWNKIEATARIKEALRRPENAHLLPPVVKLPAPLPTEAECREMVRQRDAAGRFDTTTDVYGRPLPAQPRATTPNEAAVQHINRGRLSLNTD